MNCSPTWARLFGLRGAGSPAGSRHPGPLRRARPRPGRPHSRSAESGSDAVGEVPWIGFLAFRRTGVSNRRRRRSRQPQPLSPGAWAGLRNQFRGSLLGDNRGPQRKERGPRREFALCFSLPACRLRYFEIGSRFVQPGAEAIDLMVVPRMEEFVTTLRAIAVVLWMLVTASIGMPRKSSMPCAIGDLAKLQYS